MAMIGLFDSGLGGLSVARAVRAVLPRHDLIYLADSAYCPYGPLATAQVRERALFCARWLVAHGAAVIVVACNTASSAALDVLRTTLEVPVVGMEPGIKPAVVATRTGKVAVLATSGTLQGDRFGRLVEQFAHGVTVRTVACPAMVDLVEAGLLHGADAEAVVRGYVAPLLADGVDTFVLGCTHFPPLAPVIATVAPEATLIDTGPAVAAQTARVVAKLDLAPGSGRVQAFTTGDPTLIRPALWRVWGETIDVAQALQGTIT